MCALYRFSRSHTPPHISTASLSTSLISHLPSSLTLFISHTPSSLTLLISLQLQTEEYTSQYQRHTYCTSKSFLEYITSFATLLGRKSRQQVSDIERLRAGVEILDKTGKDVSALKLELEEAQAKVTKEKAVVDKLLDNMGVQRKKLEKQRAIANSERQKAETAAEHAESIQKKAVRGDVGRSEAGCEYE